MQSEVKEKTIGEHTYRVYMLDPLTANDLLVDLGKILAPAIASLGSQVISAKDSEEELSKFMDGLGRDNNPEAIERGLLGLVDRIGKAQLREIIGILEKVTEVQQGDKWPQLSTVFAMHFRGHIGDMWKWIAFALRVQYDFLDSLASVIANVGQRTMMAA